MVLSRNLSNFVIRPHYRDGIMQLNECKERNGREVASAHRLQLTVARRAAEIEEAKRLRYRVFSEEMGAHLDAAPVAGRAPDNRGISVSALPMEARNTAGIDEDRFDGYCEHLIVRDIEHAETVGTYRILTPRAAVAAGGYYSEAEFDLARLSHLRPGMMEVGRSCVHPDYRNGAVIGLLWRGVIQYMHQHGYPYVMGCASIGLADGGRMAASTWSTVSRQFLGPADYRVFPRLRLPVEALPHSDALDLHPLIKGYIRLGAYICGEPAWDPDFNSADLLTLLPLERMDARHRRRFGIQTSSAE